MKIINWLRSNHELSSWIQTIGVLVAMILGIIQLRQTTEALQFTAKANEIMLKNSASDLLVDINTAALSNSDAAGEFSGHKRLHLMRIHYFYRAFQLRQDELMDDDHFTAEENYLRWTGTLPDFKEVWGVFRQSYSSDFRNWVDQTISKRPEKK